MQRVGCACLKPLSQAEWEPGCPESHCGHLRRAFWELASPLQHPLVCHAHSGDGLVMINSTSWRN